jgi:hypothetical protein
MQTYPLCNAAVRAAFACFARLTEGDWECDPEGLPTVKGGLCEAEQAAVAKCMQTAHAP